MKAMLSGFAAIAVIAVIANVALGEMGFSSGARTASSDVRLGE